MTRDGRNTRRTKNKLQKFNYLSLRECCHPDKWDGKKRFKFCFCFPRLTHKHGRRKWRKRNSGANKKAFRFGRAGTKKRELIYTICLWGRNKFKRNGYQSIRYTSKVDASKLWEEENIPCYKSLFPAKGATEL